MKIKIDAIDTLFFKDGKPFSMGEESWANGIFPPAPSVFYGSLRTSYFSKNLSEFKKVNTPEDPTFNLKINKISYWSEDEFFPAPADLVTDNSNKNNPDLFKLTLNDKPKYGNFPLPKILEYKGNLSKVERPEEYHLISSFSMNKYLSGDFEKITSVKLNKFITIEPKVGIGRSNTTRSAAESMIYRVGMRRLENKSSLSFLLDFEGLSISEEGILN
ncbi:type III-B CRISPR module-associated Cmr3 family protein [Melioribacter sp. OK-6-Me]|uniref:type III-B CRISPR module-associated Cmr3 family protein n=1 Tax=unclassified Melioribacter TaxID=2627329 RepID=UPI003EDAA607